MDYETIFTLLGAVAIAVLLIVAGNKAAQVKGLMSIDELLEATRLDKDT